MLRSIRAASGPLVLAAALLAGCGSAPLPPATPEVAVPPPPPPTAAAYPGPPPAATAEARSPGKDSPRRPRPTRLDGTSIRFEGGDGGSAKDAIVILGAKGESDGVASEYQYLEMMYGPRGDTWKMVQQALMEEGGKKLDALTIDRAGGRQIIYFDITDYFGKF